MGGVECLLGVFQFCDAPIFAAINGADFNVAPTVYIEGGFVAGIRVKDAMLAIVNAFKMINAVFSSDNGAKVLGGYDQANFFKEFACCGFGRGFAVVDFTPRRKPESRAVG